MWMSDRVWMSNLRDGVVCRGADFVYESDGGGGSEVRFGYKAGGW